MNFGNPIDISDIKKMNDEGIEMVQTASNLSFNAWMRKQKSGTTIKNQIHSGGSSVYLP